jgi:hypothetical protein
MAGAAVEGADTEAMHAAIRACLLCLMLAWAGCTAAGTPAAQFDSSVTGGGNDGGGGGMGM